MNRWHCLLFAFLVLLVTQAGSSCGNIVPPSGGPRDSLAPRLLKAIPRDSTTNFKGRTIELQFDEFIDLQDTRANLTVSPMYDAQPEITARLRTLTIRLKDSLEANTTYTFNFGNSIRDINESNVLKNFSYSFSTGPALDSLTLTGRVRLAETGDIDTTLLVELFRSFDDSAVVKNNPRYITHLDGQGRFGFQHLPAGLFALYALEDKSNTHRYLAKTQLFAFSDSAIRSGQTAPVTLYAYRETPAPAAGAAPGGGRGVAQGAADRRLKYSAPASAPQDLMSDFRIAFDNKVKSYDSSKIRLTIDSTFRRVAAKVTLDSTGRGLVLSTKWIPGAQYNLVLEKDFATDSTGRSALRNDTVRIAARKLADYGKLLLRFRNVKSGTKPVLQFLQNNNIVLSVPVGSGTFNRDLFTPGEYSLRVLFDDNGNGRWDPGTFFGAKRQPELAVPVERKLVVKADIDNEIEIALPDKPE